MPAPWNAVFPVRHASLGILAIASGQNLCRQGISIPLGFTPWNSCSAFLRAPREIHISDSAAYFTGVAKSDRTGEDRLDLLNRSDAIPLGLGNALSRFYIKSSISSEGGWSFFILNRRP